MYTFIVVKQKYASLGSPYGSWLKPTLENKNAKAESVIKTKISTLRKALQMFLSSCRDMYDKKKEDTSHGESLPTTT